MHESSKIQVTNDLELLVRVREPFEQIGLPARHQKKLGSQYNQISAKVEPIQDLCQICLSVNSQEHLHVK